jgi:hypothetical protein
MHSIGSASSSFSTREASEEKLVEFRRELCRRSIKGRNYRIVDARCGNAAAPAYYRATIINLNRDDHTVFECLIGDGMRWRMWRLSSYWAIRCFMTAPSEE